MGRPRLYTEEQRREMRRVKSAAWRAANLAKSREIVRNSEKRRAARAAIAEGRIPGKVGPKKVLTEAQAKAKRLKKSKLYYYRHQNDVKAKAAAYQQKKRDAIKAGTYVPKVVRLTAEEKRLAQVASSQNRRARLRGNGGKHTKQDILDLFEDQGGKCVMCLKAFEADGYHVDHIVPIVLGGSNAPWNLQLLHPACNLEKADKSPANEVVSS